MGCSIVVSCEQMRRLEQEAFARGIKSIEMMEEAARAVVQAAVRMAECGKIGVVCGGGNNGGDGLAAARLLMEAGRQVDVLLLAVPERLKGDAARNYQRLADLNPSFLSTEDFATNAYALIIDAVLGTGLEKKPLRPGHAAAISAINALGAGGVPILAVDIPSGVLGDTGETLDPCVKATETVALGCRKPGHLLFPGRACCGRVSVAPLSGLASPQKPDFLQTNAHAVDEVFPARPIDSHKGTYGHVLVLAGSRGMMGAGAMASAAALRTGSGLVSWGYPRGETPSAPWTVMTRPLSSIDGMLDGMAIKDVLDLAERASALAVGPGLGQSPQTRAFVRGILERTQLPMVLDADGINVLHGHTEWILPREHGVMTPHPGEMARLLGITIPQVTQSPVDTARQAAEATGWTVLLKGATTVIAAPGRATVLNTSGNPGMATAGSGDTLTGIVASLLGQGLSGYDAAWAGAWIHGRAGGIAAQKVGMPALTALDILDGLPQALPRRPWEESE